MALSIHTNYSSMVTTNALNKTSAALGSNQQAAGTGYRINSAADDAAGLQMATRLKAQSNGMDMAMRNTDNAVSLLQTAEGAFTEMTDIVQRMKNLATLSANDTNSGADRVAMQEEYDELGKEIANIINNTKFAGENLFGDDGKLADKVTFQIGASEAETLDLDVADKLTTLTDSLKAISMAFDEATGGTVTRASGTADATLGEELVVYTAAIAGKPADAVAGTPAVDAVDATYTKPANPSIDKLATTLDDITALRSKFGATINRLGHTSNNLANMKDNTDAAYGGIMDTDFAKVSADMTKNNMLMQSSISMLKQAGQMPGLVMSLLG